jgi:hypothetical protein
MKYTPETGFLYSSRIITDSVQATRFLAIYIYMEYAVFLWELFWGGLLARPKGKN